MHFIEFRLAKYSENRSVVLNGSSIEIIGEKYGNLVSL